MKIGISGSACVGKTTLARALAEKLSVPCIEEEMRRHLEMTKKPLSELPTARVTSILSNLWRVRSLQEDILPSFVADNCCLDFAAYARYYNCFDSEDNDLFTAALEHLPYYDAIFVLSMGVLPYICDGIRSADASSQKRYQKIIEDLLRLYAWDKVFFVPENCRTVEERVEWVLEQLRARRPGTLLAGTAENKPHAFVRDPGQRHAGMTGVRILVARARPAPSEIAAKLRSLGADVVESPQIAVRPFASASFSEALKRGDHRAIVFCCAAGVETVFEQADLTLFAGRPVIAVGKDAADRLRDYGVQPASELHGACKEALGGESQLSGKILVATSDEGRPSLVQDLAQLGAQADVVPVYRYERSLVPSTWSSIDAVVLPSSSAARNVLERAPKEFLEMVPMIAIGPKTEEAARGCGARIVRVASHDTAQALVEEAVKVVTHVDKHAAER